MKIPLNDILARLTGIGPNADAAEVEAGLKRLNDYVEQSGDAPIHLENIAPAGDPAVAEHSPEFKAAGDAFLKALQDLNATEPEGSTGATDPAPTE